MQAIGDKHPTTTTNMPKNSPEVAMKIAFEKEDDRLRVLRRLIKSAQIASEMSPDVWAVTPLPKGFRLNVGQVEVLTCVSGTVRVNIAGAVEAIPIEQSVLAASAYSSIRQPHCAFVGTAEEYSKYESALDRPHADFIRLAAHSPTGKPRTSTSFKDFHSEALMAYAAMVTGYRPTVRTQSTRHFAAYYRAEEMGRAYDLKEESAIFSGEPSAVLEQMVGNLVWVICCEDIGGVMNYTLADTFVPGQVVTSGNQDVSQVVCGFKRYPPAGPVKLNDLTWFAAFIKSQAAFNFGINEITDIAVQFHLLSLCPEPGFGGSEKKDRYPPIDIDKHDFYGTEGAHRYVEHLTRERSPALVKKKKKECLDQTGNLKCEVCKFDFFIAYGELGENFCEVHHKTPLAELPGSRKTKLSDLAIVCSNCHRMLHREKTVLTVEQLNKRLQIR